MNVGKEGSNGVEGSEQEDGLLLSISDSNDVRLSVFWPITCTELLLVVSAFELDGLHVLYVCVCQCGQ